MSTTAKWGDLLARLGSALLLVFVCGIEIYLGGITFSILVWLACAVMIWELARMFDASSPLVQGLVGAAALALSENVPVALGGGGALFLPIALAAALVCAQQVPRDRLIFGLAVIWVLTGAYAFLLIRHVAGLEWLIWLVALVIVSDILGYFVGRSLGGPKFWPRISPKKTWSGTIAGWIGAAVTGVALLGLLGGSAAAWQMALLSALTAFAGQLGDIAESAVKRRTGVKDSSSLIPGHGGALDRFDAMLGAAAFMLLLWSLALVPGL